jgi:RNA polymerase-binding transcription factor DksA
MAGKLIRIEERSGRPRVVADGSAGRMGMTAIEQRKEQLQSRLGELQDRLHRIDNELDQPVSEDFSEQATEREAEEVLEDLGAAGLLEIRMIEAALRRIEDGTYGICVSCGDPIGEERLDVLPHTPRCRACASQAAPGR